MTEDTVPHDSIKSCNDGLWPEFTKDMADELNEKRCLVLASPPERAADICRCVDRVCSRFGNAGSEAENDDANPSDIVGAFKNSPRVCFTLEENIAKLHKCTAVYGELPMLLVLEMDKDRSFLLHINPDPTTSEKETKGEEEEEKEKNIRMFLRGVASGSYPPALKGAAPPADDHFARRHGITLRYGLCAVTSTLARLKRRERGGAVCVFWSERCAICPAVVAMVDALAGIVLRTARRHSATSPFTYIVCNIDENELPKDDWPELPQRQTVPTLAAYTAEGGRIVFSGERTAVRIVSFICEHCLPKDLATAREITVGAIEEAEKLKECDKLWDVISNSVGSKENEDDNKASVKGDEDSQRAHATATEVAGQKRPRVCSYSPLRNQEMEKST